MRVASVSQGVMELIKGALGTLTPFPLRGIVSVGKLAAVEVMYRLADFAPAYAGVKLATSVQLRPAGNSAGNDCGQDVGPPSG